MFFFLNDTAPTEIYTLPLLDALPIPGSRRRQAAGARPPPPAASELQPRTAQPLLLHAGQDRKSTRLNSSHANISYAVFCLKKKKHHLVKETCHVTSCYRPLKSNLASI